LKKALSTDQIQRLFPWIPHGPVLDLGAGEGTWSQILSHYGFEVTGLESDPHRAEAFQQNLPKLTLLQKDLREVDLGNEAWASIFCLNLFPFLPQSEHAQELKRIAKALVPGGVLVFSSFSSEDPGANHSFARSVSGEVLPTGILSLESLKQYFSDWEIWFEFSGRVSDHHPPLGAHEHGLVQLIARKPEPEPAATVWETLPYLGAGLGWRPPLEGLFAHEGVADFIEIMTDDFLDPVWDASLLRLSRHYPVIPHGVELSVGSCEGLDPEYLLQVKRILARCKSPWWSDHLCFTHGSGIKTWSLNPLPCTEEALTVVLANAKHAIKTVGAPLLLENPAYYWRPELSEQLTDAAFFRKIVLEADAGILLDVANLYGNAKNLGLDPYAFIETLPADRIIQIHLAGGRIYKNMIFDTHDQAIFKETWELLKFVLRRSGVKAVSIERDDRFDDLQALIAEVDTARQLLGLRV